MAPKAKARRILVKLVSTALTGSFYTTSRVRVGDKLAKIKYDPIVKKHVLFTEAKIK
ncbi:ribosomal protein L33 [Cryptococcus amylolentus CBS 6039]|uniref:Large ribosomal subunit protein bL33m n=4 Tax=Cryptococcus TaxID=5206 RepID=A0A1E3HV87_9TREE|nr:ribosomal protein L33 [Cryptococcus amylolentus CBS 6039]XP_019035399.1 ribosomal protein L33 [Cryptococcus wingfieldii CBS 7118]ODO07805.1 ribosomal protein L33 [Cryptococcus amylolentus CBS 6273]TYJ53070.1 ribosomal protein L33 [Cryptococcus floricola]ODN79441.1 ribosomal protein L33 [Cryptococcus amylolentus CBS 6039]ODO08543.1 ribosomal protein L33 [Cryptococcus wingfieldii CBS 7118]